MVIMKSLIVVTIVLFAVYQAVDGVTCFRRCDNVKCDNENLVCSDSEILVKNGSPCSCCDDCHRKIYEGTPCLPHFWGVPLRAKCVDGLICQHDEKVQMSVCTKKN
uniref:Uncharacterized protein LOC114324157 n=1 Tax=Diabrotica virgifera virgifera TaxID=50390 RepID=A0A6P7F2F5_DIAVI